MAVRRPARGVRSGVRGGPCRVRGRTRGGSLLSPRPGPRPSSRRVPAESEAGSEAASRDACRTACRREHCQIPLGAALRPDSCRESAAAARPSCSSSTNSWFAASSMAPAVRNSTIARPWVESDNATGLVLGCAGVVRVGSGWRGSCRLPAGAERQEPDPGPRHLHPSRTGPARHAGHPRRHAGHARRRARLTLDRGRPYTLPDVDAPGAFVRTARSRASRGRKTSVNRGRATGPDGEDRAQTR